MLLHHIISCYLKPVLPVSTCKKSGSFVHSYCIPENLWSTYCVSLVLPVGITIASVHVITWVWSEERDNFFRHILIDRSSVFLLIHLPIPNSILNCVSALKWGRYWFSGKSKRTPFKNEESIYIISGESKRIDADSVQEWKVFIYLVWILRAMIYV